MFFVAALLLAPLLPGIVFEALTTAIDDRRIGAALLFVVGSVPVLALLRLGLLPTIAMLFVGVTAANFASADYSAWYAAPGITGMVMILPLTAISFRFALGGRPVWPRDILEG